MNGNETHQVDTTPPVRLSTFAVDTRDRCTQAVARTYACEPDGRFYVVEAHCGREALEIALAARNLGCKSIVEYRALLALQSSDNTTGAVMATDSQMHELVQEAAQTRRRVVVLLCGSATPMHDLHRLEEVRSKLADLDVEVVATSQEALAKAQIRRDMLVLEALGATGDIGNLIEILAPIEPLLERPVRVEGHVDDRPAWVSPYGPARHRRR